MSQGRQHTFTTLFLDVDSVEIPIIQRDYAQGRARAEDVRFGFLSALHSALLAEDGSSIDLDFIYGSFEAKGSRVLSLLDGQQRLTTLFLLHWYIAMRAGHLDDFQQRWARKGRSRFTYATRPSAGEFFDALATAQFVLPDDQTHGLTVSAWLLDCSWFFLAWRSDPTVKSCLAMLDAIHEVFGVTAAGLYPTLIDGDRPRITFHFLNLEDFGLSDDLYIKMNARGKPLTPFENFKAWLVARISDQPWAKQFDLAMDQKWIDFFWRLASKSGVMSGGSPFDDLFLRFMYLMAFFEACTRLERPFMSTQAETAWIVRLREAYGSLPLREFENRNTFSPATVQVVALVLDYFSASATSQEIALLERALSRRHDWPDLVKLNALVAFIRNADGVPDAQVRTIAKSRWERVTSNLIANTRLDGATPTAAAVKGLEGLSSHLTSLYESLAHDNALVSGFTRGQVNEEARKASLIIRDPDCEAYFVDAESHGYLQGCIGFLIDFSQDANGYIDMEAFRRYSRRSKAVLDVRILNSKEHLLERALLSLDDYLVDRGSFKYSFCQPNATAFRDRSENWLRVVGRTGFRGLLDQLGDDVEASLREIIRVAACGDWRKYVVADPQMLRYCHEHLIHRESMKTIYLLSRTRRSGYFVELRSYALYQSLLRDRGALVNALLEYVPVYGYTDPALELTLDGLKLKVRYTDGAWICTKAGEVAPLPPALEKMIEERGFVF